MNTQLETALTFAKNNVRVFPLKCNSKGEQILHSWKEEATTDIEQIKKWFSETNNNIGICTGDGLAVIDVDVKQSSKGKELIQNNLSNFPNTHIVKTPSGGYHLYYKVDRSIKNRVRIYDEIDIHGENGYVVGEGSSIDGNSYISNNRPIANANEFVYQFLEGNKEKKEPATVAQEGINEGQRNDYLFRLGCFMQSKGMEDDSIYAALAVENQKKCKPPLEEDEVNNIFQSVLRYQKQIIAMPDKQTLNGRFTVKQLMDEKLENIPSIVEDMLTPGVALLGAPQKTGKTFFCLQLADAITNGKDFFGRKVKQGPVLYLAFEDHKYSFSHRLKRMGVEPNENLIIRFFASGENFDLKKCIEEEFRKKINFKAIIIDTFAKIRKSGDRDYESEYKEIAEYHKLGLLYGLSIVLVTHLRKEINPALPFDSIYGSRGLTAGADCILVMYKRNHISKTRQLTIQGKDIPDDEITLVQTDKCTFEIAESEYDEALDENLSKVINFIVDKKSYEGSHDQLCSELKLNIRGKGLSMLMRKNIELLKDSNITYEILPRTNKARKMKLQYLGDDPI